MSDKDDASEFLSGSIGEAQYRSRLKKSFEQQGLYLEAKSVDGYTVQSLHGIAHRILASS